MSNHIWVSPQLGKILKFSTAFLGSWCALQWKFGSQPDGIFRHTFQTEKHPYTLTEYYGTEDFLQELALLPQFYHLIMDGVVLDENGKAAPLGGALQVEDVFRTRELDTTGDGEEDTVEWFNKKMIMEGYIFRWLAVKWVYNFGFYSNPDGKTCECYHEVDYFYGPWPLNIGLHLHSYLVLWLTRRRIRNIVEDDDEEEE